MSRVSLVQNSPRIDQKIFALYLYFYIFLFLGEMITVKIMASTLSNPVPQPAHRSIKSAVFVSRFEKEKKSLATLAEKKESMPN